MKKSFHPSYFIYRLCAKSLNLVRLVLSWPRTSHHIVTCSILTSYLTSHHYSPRSHLILSRPRTSCRTTTHLVLPCSILTLYFASHCNSSCSIPTLYLASYCYSPHSILTLYLTLHCYSPHSISTSYFDLTTIAHCFYLTQCCTSASHLFAFI
jgi:hypothetical protein